MSSPEAYDGPPTGPPGPSGHGSAAGWLIVGGQLAGLLMVLVGGYYLMALLVRVIGFINAPEAMSAALDATMAVIGGEKLVVPNGGNGVSLGRLAAMGVLAVWHIIWLLVAGQVVRIGAALLSTGRDDRQLLEATVRATVAAALEKSRKPRG